jgi:Fe-S-cluster containining protein
MEKIETYVQTMPKAERKRLAAQKRDKSDCGFLDKANYRCAIYPVRPWICEAFGRIKGMQCVQVTGLVQIIPSFLEETGRTEEYKSGVAGISNHFNWLKK